MYRGRVAWSARVVPGAGTGGVEAGGRWDRGVNDDTTNRSALGPRARQRDENLPDEFFLSFSSDSSATHTPVARTSHGGTAARSGPVRDAAIFPEPQRLQCVSDRDSDGRCRPTALVALSNTMMPALPRTESQRRQSGHRADAWLDRSASKQCRSSDLSTSDGGTYWTPLKTA